MRHAFWTEVMGWREALADPEVVLTIVWRLVGAALWATVGTVGVLYAEPLAVVVGVTCVVLVASLVSLRTRGRP